MPLRKRRSSGSPIRSPGQANSYFYGYTRLLQLRKDTQTALGPKFDALKFHDFC